MQIPDDKQLIMGIALGYRNQATKINVFYTERSEVDKFLTYRDDPKRGCDISLQKTVVNGL